MTLWMLLVACGPEFGLLGWNTNTVTRTLADTDEPPAPGPDTDAEDDDTGDSPADTGDTDDTGEPPDTGGPPDVDSDTDCSTASGWIDPLDGVDPAIAVYEPADSEAFIDALDDIGTDGGVVYLKPETTYALPSSWKHYGGQADTPLIIMTDRRDGDYSTERAVLVPAEDKTNGISGVGNSSDERHHVFFNDVIVKQHDDAEGSGDGISLVGDYFENWTLQGVRIVGFQTGLVWQADTFGGQRNMVIRRSVIATHGTYSHSQGIFVANVDGLELYDNFFLGEAWPDIEDRRVTGDGGPTIFGHHNYIQKTVDNVTANGNFYYNAQATGAQFRSGGHFEHNLAYQCPIGFTYGNEGEDLAVRGDSVIENNVVWNGIHIRPDGTDYGLDYRRQWGFFLNNALIEANELWFLDPADTDDQNNQKPIGTSVDNHGDRSKIDAGSYLRDIIVDGGNDYAVDIDHPDHNLDIDGIVIPEGADVLNGITDAAGVSVTGAVERAVDDAPLLDEAFPGWLDEVRGARCGDWPTALTAERLIEDHLRPVVVK